MGDINVGDITNNGGIINIGSGNVDVPDPGIPALHQLPDPPPRRRKGPEPESVAPALR